LHEEVAEKPISDEPAVEEIAPETKTKDSDPSTLTKMPPMRVDSGIEVESPTEVKSALEVEPLRTVLEDPAIEDATIAKPAENLLSRSQNWKSRLRKPKAIWRSQSPKKRQKNFTTPSVSQPVKN
jgi:hypothetical protein